MSDGVVKQRWGSHWSWRWMLAALLLALLVSAYVLAEQWLVRSLVPSHAPPAVIRVTQRSQEWLEGFDWRTGERFKMPLYEHIPTETVHETMQTVLDGKAVAWMSGWDLHVVDLQPPHLERLFKCPLKPEQHSFLGLSRDGNFALFQAVGTLQKNPDGSTSVTLEPTFGGQRQMIVLSIVDLRTGEARRVKEWESTTAPSRSAGEFESTLRATTLPPLDPNEPSFARWTISPEGEWQKVDSSVSKRLANVVAVRDAKGRLQWPEDEAAANSDPAAVQLTVVKWSSSGKRMLACSIGESCSIVDAEAKTMRPLETPYGLFTAAAFLDEDTIIVSDLHDDIRVIDVSSGKTIARDLLGSLRRTRMRWVAAGLALVAAFWMTLAFRERNLFWALSDSLIALTALQFVLVAIMISLFSLESGGGASMRRLMEYAPLVFSVVASNVGAGVVVGWYWAHGRGFLVWRWLYGAVWLSIGSLPAAAAISHVDARTNSPEVVFAAFVAFGVLLGSLTSLVVVGLRSLRWTIYHAPLSENPSRFGLATCFLVTGGIGVLIPIGQWFFSSNGHEGPISPVGLAVGAAVAAVVLVALLMSRARWYFLTAAWGLWIATVVAGVMILALYLPRVLPYLFVCMLESSAVVGIVVAIAIPCLVLRTHGWHWVRAKKEVPSSVKAANLQPT